MNDLGIHLHSCRNLVFCKVNVLFSYQAQIAIRLGEFVEISIIGPHLNATYSLSRPIEVIVWRLIKIPTIL